MPGSTQATTQTTTQTADGNSQALPNAASPVTNGQAPTFAHSDAANNNTGASNAQAPSSSQDSSSTSSGSAEEKRAQQELAEARREAARYRAELKTLTDAQLTAEQKRERDFSELQARTQEQESRLQRQSLELAGYRLAGSLGISDISAALALIQVEHRDAIKYAASGEPENLPDLFKAVLAAHPILGGAAGSGSASAGQANGQPAGGLTGQRASASSGGATNPGASARGGVYTREQVRNMSTAEYAVHKAAIAEQMKRNGGRL